LHDRAALQPIRKRDLKCRLPSNAWGGIRVTPALERPTARVLERGYVRIHETVNGKIGDC